MPSPYIKFGDEVNSSRSATYNTGLSESEMQANNIKRKADITALLNAVHQYLADNTASTSGLGITFTDEPKVIATPLFAAFCSVLVPNYIANLPADPRTIFAKTGITQQLCSPYAKWSTEYTISMNRDGVITIAAKRADLGQQVTVSR
jgi:hypothetical protein